MADVEDVGAAFTGMSATPQRTDPATASGQWDDFLSRPGNRQALLQIGLQMMQPIGIGQTVGGHVAQAIGAGGEAVDRNFKMDLAQEKLAADEEETAGKQRVAQQNADNYGVAVRNKPPKGVGLTDAFRARAARQDAQQFERQLDKDAAAIVKQANDPLQEPNSDVVKTYRGKTVPEVREMLRGSRPKPQYGSVPNNDAEDDATQDEGDMPAGAQKAPDGNYYVADPKRPGKYLRVNP